MAAILSSGDELNHWSVVAHHIASWNLIIIDLGNGLSPGSAKPLPEPVSICKQWGPMAFICIHKRCFSYQLAKEVKHYRNQWKFSILLFSSKCMSKVSHGLFKMYVQSLAWDQFHSCFFIKIQIWLNVHLVIIPFMICGLLKIFSHVTTTQLSSHIHNIVVIMWWWVR